jgi:polyferredoxin
LSVTQHLSFLRIRRVEEGCKGCALCETPCPMGIKVASANPAVSAACIGCLKCVDACPKHGVLSVQLAPTWLDPVKRRMSRNTTA